MPIIQKFMEALRGAEAEEYVKGLLLCFGAPTIRGLKAASLINFRREGEDLRALWRLRGAEWLASLGVEWVLLDEGPPSQALVMIYRRELLARALGGDGAADILRALDYPLTGPRPDVDACLEHLRSRFRSGCPHEVGLFLDYPPEDVREFMEGGESRRKPLAVGYWKVYGNAGRARRAFRRYRRAEHDAARSLLCNIV